MKHKALVVEDDPHAVEMIEDVLAALGHGNDSAGSLLEARGLLKAGSYSYVLLDLEFPARSRRCVPRIQNAENFLDAMAEARSKQATPVIVMSSLVPRDSEQATEMMRLATSLRQKGATDFIGKPFPTAGRTLDRVIKKVLGANGDPRRRGRRRSTKTKASRLVPRGKESGSTDHAKVIGQKPDAPEAKASGPQQTAAIEPLPWDHVPNKPIALDRFMVKYCEKRSKETRKYRRKALLAAARNSTCGKGSVALPSPAVPGRPTQKRPTQGVLHARSANCLAGIH